MKAWRLLAVVAFAVYALSSRVPVQTAQAAPEPGECQARVLPGLPPLPPAATCFVTPALPPFFDQPQTLGPNVSAQRQPDYGLGLLFIDRSDAVAASGMQPPPLEATCNGL